MAKANHRRETMRQRNPSIRPTPMFTGAVMVLASLAHQRRMLRSMGIALPQPCRGEGKA